MSKKFETRIIYFRYDHPKTIKTIKEWDKAPLVLILRLGKKMILGFNIHWLSVKDRKRFLDVVVERGIETKRRRNSR